MQKVLFALALLGLLATGCQQNSVSAPSSDVPPAVLKTAKDYQIDYPSILERARKKDPSGLYDLLDFHRIAEGVEGVEHGLVCLQLIPVVGDEAFAEGCQKFNLKRRKIMLDRLLLAQGKTTDPKLQAPLAKWAPSTWDALRQSDPMFNQPQPADTSAVKSDTTYRKRPKPNNPK